MTKRKTYLQNLSRVEQVLNDNVGKTMTITEFSKKCKINPETAKGIIETILIAKHIRHFEVYKAGKFTFIVVRNLNK